MSLNEMTGPPELESTPAENRRRDTRRAAACTTAMMYASGAEAHLFGKTVAVTDLSLHGIGFNSEASLVIGRMYGLEIQGNWMNLSSRVRVVSCREGKVGAEFC